MMHRALFALAPAVMLAACGSAPVDPEAALEAVHATEQAQLQAIAAKDLRGAVRNYRDDAVLVAPGSAPATTGEAIAAEFDALLNDRNFKLEIEPGPGWVSESGELAVTTSTGTLTTTDAASGQPVTVTVGNQTVWQKPTGKPWQIVSDYNVALPAETQVAEAE
jgi:ketosteroid isomerase-like protein